MCGSDIGVAVVACEGCAVGSRLCIPSATRYLGDSLDRAVLYRARQPREDVCSELGIANEPRVRTRTAVTQHDLRGVEAERRDLCS